MIQMFKGFSRMVDRVSDAALMPNADLSKALGALGLILLATFAVAISAVVARVSSSHRPPPAVFLSQGTAHQRVPTLADPSLSVIKIQRWVTRSTREIFSFNFANYDTRIAGDQVFFTDMGWEAFQQGLTNSKVESRVKTSQLDVFLVPVATARVIDSRVIKHTLVFRTQMPALMVYKSASDIEVKNVMVSISVRQVPTSENPDGLGISDIALQINH